jgi:glutaredoxin
MKFTVYSKNGCPYCTKTIQVLEKLNLEYVEYKLGDDFTREEFYGEFGNGTTFPQVLADQTKLGGCSDTIRYLQEKKIL